MNKEDWRVNYLKSELATWRRKLEDAEYSLEQAKNEINVLMVNRDQAKVIVEMLEAAYKVRAPQTGGDKYHETKKLS